MTFGHFQSTIMIFNIHTCIIMIPIMNDEIIRKIVKRNCQINQCLILEKKKSFDPLFCFSILISFCNMIICLNSCCILFSRHVDLPTAELLILIKSLQAISIFILHKLIFKYKIT